MKQMLAKKLFYIYHPSIAQLLPLSLSTILFNDNSHSILLFSLQTGNKEDIEKFSKRTVKVSTYSFGL